MGERIYFDNNASTRVDDRVVEAMLPYFTDKYANPSSIHKDGQECRGTVETAREKVAQLLNADPKEIIFTSGGTESDNTAIKGVAYSLRDKGKHIITTSIEHNAVLNPCKFLEVEGFDVTYLGVDENGMIDIDELKESIRDDTILLTIMYANNEIGTIEPIEEIGSIARERGIYFHTDAVQAVGKIKVDVKKLNIDFLSLAGHKIYGPKGVGILYARAGLNFLPLIQGGHHESYRRAGTENVPGIVGIGKACEIAMNEMEKEAVKISKLKDKLENGLKRDFTNIRINGHPNKRLYNTVNFSLKNIDAQDILIALDREGIDASSGSACFAGVPEPSHVLKAIGIPKDYINGTIRISLGKFNTEDEVDRFLNIFPKIVERIQKG